MDEKAWPPRATRSNLVGVCLAGIRVWQWTSSFFVWASFGLLHDHVQRGRLGASDRMRAVQYLGLASLVYSTLVIGAVHVSKTLCLRSWRVSAVASLPGDLAIMGICLAKITLLALSGLPADCHGLAGDDYDGSGLVRQPADGYGTIRLGSSATATSGELDRLCTLPRTVYGLSVAAIFSYTFSLLLSVLYLQQHQRQALCGGPGHAGPLRSGSPRPSLRCVVTPGSTGAPSILDLDDDDDDDDEHHPAGARGRATSPPRQGSPRSTTSARAPRTSSRASSSSSSSSSGWGGTTLLAGGTGDADSVVPGGSLPPRPPPWSALAWPQRRWSTSTSSSYGADAFVVTDGFRPPGASEPPGYCSRPGSLYQEPMKYEAGLGMPGAPKKP